MTDPDDDVNHLDALIVKQTLESLVSGCEYWRTRSDEAESLLDRIQYTLDNYSELVAHRRIGEIMNERKAA